MENEKQIFTAEEFLISKHKDNRFAYGRNLGDIIEEYGGTQALKEMLIEFAQVHVTAAVKAAAKKACLLISESDSSLPYSDDHYVSYNDYGEKVDVTVDFKSILNSYDLNNVK